MSRDTAKPYAIILIVIILAAAVAVGAYSIYLLSQNATSQPSMMPVPSVETARNWAGYVAASDPQNPQSAVIGASASWTVPTITDIGIDAFSAIWIGIGGQFDQTLIQVGTEQDFVGGQAQYSFWYEMLPDDSVTIDTIDVSPGDQIEASINLVNSNSNQWSISITDVTTGQNYQNIFTYNSEKLSAEWIIERPAINNVISILADFGNVTFTDCKAVFLDKSGSISDFPHNEVVMDAQLRHNQMVQLVEVSELNNQGTQFTINYLTS